MAEEWVCWRIVPACKARSLGLLECMPRWLDMKEAGGRACMPALSALAAASTARGAGRPCA